MNICIIPARGGSVRIPRKNIKIFYGKPIIAYSIDAAIKSNCFEKVIVSTDDDEIAEVALRYGAEVPFRRPAILSDDFVGTIPVVKHAIEWMEKNNHEIENVCCLYATAAFIEPIVLSSAYEKLIDQKTDYCFSVTSYSFPVERSLTINEDNQISMLFPENFNTRSQDLYETFHDAGQFYWGKASAFKNQTVMFSSKAYPYKIARHFVQDIDTEEDWKRAELMYEVLNKNQ
jgi:pseudaminic acid cytidylyltransferase